MKIRLKGLTFKGTEKSTGFDLHCSKDTVINPLETKKVSTGVYLELPDRYDAQIRPRSGMSSKGLLCHFGTIDNDYRGELLVVITNLTTEKVILLNGQRIAQLVFTRVEPIEIERIEGVSINTERGCCGFGSTG